MEPALVVLASGPGYEGFLVIDSLLNDRSSGGVRITADLKLEEIRDLAREMTFKFALFRLPRGGAKAGVRLASNLDGPAREQALKGFGRQIGPIIRAGLYSPGTDLNCGVPELRKIYAGAGIALGAVTDSAFYTAAGVASAVEGCADALGLARPAAVAIEGFGKVATHLAGMLPAAEFRITTISTIAGAITNPDGFSPPELQRLRAEHGDGLVHHLPGTTLPMPEVLTAPADILVPAARTGSITEDVARGIRARAVVPAANAPYRPAAAGILHERGVLCLPGCLCNAGGVLGSSLVDSGVPRDRVEQLFRSRYRPMVRDLVATCLRKRLSPVSVVEAVATREAEGRAAGVPPGARSRSLPRRACRKLSREAARRLPRALRRRGAWQRGRRAFDALDADFRAVGSP
jgi:glutamate dehydrogenase/leucine dehydrogenase